MSHVRCKLEQSAPVWLWHHSLTKNDSASLEKAQKTAVLKVILKDRYKSYGDALKILKLHSFEQRRNKLTLNLAKSSLKLEKMKQLFPLNTNDHQMTIRNYEKFRGSSESISVQKFTYK